MKFTIKGPFKESFHNLMRKAGYCFKGKNEVKSELVFTRPPSGFPRFHLFLKEGDDDLIFNLHLDQKKPVYGNMPAHAGEYQSEAVSRESERIKQVLEK